MIKTRVGLGLRLVASALLIAPCLTGQAHAATRATAIPTLGRIPTDCPPGSPRTVLGKVYGTGSSVTGYGAFPVAGLAFDGPHATLQFSRNPQMLHLSWQPPYGWIHKMLWFMNPSHKGRVTLRGSELRGGRPVWFVLDGPGQKETRLAVLDPQHQAVVPGPRGAWPQFPGYMYVPHAGCYSIVAQWSGGQETIAFAAGQ